MLMTPLFPAVSAIFLKIFGQEMIVLRVLEAFQIAGILFIAYKIMTKLKMNKGISLILAVAIYFYFEHIGII